jgi:transcription initiation factor TFIID subunit 12
MLLEMADDFVDKVVSQACKLAKHRGADHIEVKDLQLPIEKLYNIRVPGFVDASREVNSTISKTKAGPSTYQEKASAVKKAQREAGAR